MWKAMLGTSLAIELISALIVCLLNPSMIKRVGDVAQAEAEPPRIEPRPTRAKAEESLPTPKKRNSAPARADDERIKAAQAEKEALENSERALLKATSLNLGESLARLQKSIDAMKPADLEA